MVPYESDYWFIGNFDGEEVGGAVGQMLVHFSIEENRQAGKAVARIAAQLLDSGAANVFHQVSGILIFLHIDVTVIQSTVAFYRVLLSRYCTILNAGIACVLIIFEFGSRSSILFQIYMQMLVIFTKVSKNKQQQIITNLKFFTIYWNYCIQYWSFVGKFNNISYFLSI